MSTLDNISKFPKLALFQKSEVRHRSATLGVVALLVVPLIFVLYTSRVVFVIPGVRYWLDYATYALSFLFACILVLRWQSKTARAALLSLIAAPLVLFHVACVLYFRFFADRMPFDVVFQIADIPHIRTGIEAIVGIPDVIWLVLVPTLLGAYVVLTMPPVPVRKSAIWSGFPLALLLVGQGLLGPADDYETHDPLVSFLWEGIELLEEKYGAADRYKEIAIQRGVLYPADTKYVYSNPSRGLFLKVPRQQPPNPPANRPNVVLILMESVRALESGAYGADVSFTPFLDKLSNRSLTVRRFYANGFQTARSEFAVLTSNYPNLGRAPHYIVNPHVRLLTLPDILQTHGYSTLWISSYTADFDQKRRFLLAHGIQRIYDGEHCPQGNRIGWGPDDETMLRWGASILDRQQQPFFCEIMTLSNHFPFDRFPTDGEAPRAAGGKIYDGYARGIYYTDHAVGNFIRSASRKPWFKNTIFVITGDHGIFVFPESAAFDRHREMEAVFRVPLLIYSPHLVQPENKDIIASHVDLAPTILDLLGIDHPNTFLGRSLVGNADPEDQHALMVHQNHWVLRRGNMYFYGGEKVERKYRYLHPSEAYGGKWEWIEGAFQTTGDLLFGGSRVPMPPTQKETGHWIDWGRNALLYNRLALAKDWAFTPQH